LFCDEKNGKEVNKELQRTLTQPKAQRNKKTAESAENM